MKLPSVRTLFIVFYGQPYPPSNGASLRYWQLINIMKKFGPIGVFSFYPEKSNNQTNPVVDLYHCFVNREERSFWEKFELRFWWLYPHGHHSITRPYTKAGVQELQEVLEKLRPDLVIGEMAAYRYVPLFNRYGCRFILDQHNLRTTWEKELFSAESGSQFLNLTLHKKIERSFEMSRFKSIERDLIRQADQVWLCSALEDKQLQKFYGQVSHTHVVPNAVDVAYYDCVRLGKCHLPEGLEEKQRNLLYIGHMSYPPNLVAVELLIEQIYPLLRQIYPDCCLVLVGGGRATQRIIEATKQDSGIIVTGKVPDVRPYLAAASAIAVPLRHGGGTRLKILEAFAAGCPVVSTAKGAEGLKVKDGQHLLIREDIEEIVDGVCQLWSDSCLGKRLADCAYELVKAEYSWQAVGRKVESAVQELF